MQSKAACQALLAITLSALLAAAPAAQPPPPTTGPGQGSPGPGPMLLERLRPIMDEMQVNDEQRAIIETIATDIQQRMESAREELRDFTPEQRREHFQGLMRELRDEISQVLTPEQREILRQRADQLRQRPGLVERLKENLGKLELSEDQKKKTDTVLADTQKQLDELREALRNGDEDARRRLGELLQETRRRLDQLLSTEQREKLRELLTQGNAPPAPATAPAATPGQSRREMSPESDLSMMDQESAMDQRASAGGEQRHAAMSQESSEPALAPGAAAPDFELKKLDGALVRLSSFDGRVVVLVGGSYTCPVFREQANDLEALKKELGQRANILLVYTKEAHAAGEWEVARNRKDEIAIHQHKTMDQRKAAAKTACAALKLSVPVVLDTLENTVAEEFGIFPNGAVVIGRGGKVVAVQRWFSSHTLSRRIDEALKMPATQPA